MESEKKTKFSGIEYIFGIVIIALAAYFYIGFYFPDDYTLAFGLFPQSILWIVRIFFPIIITTAIVLYSRVRRKKTDYKVVVVLSTAVFFATIVGYHIADRIYQDWFDRHRNKFHPYLQLVPQKYILRNDPSPDRVKIFCLGGSTTELTDSHGKDWESRVETILKNRFGNYHVEVHNLGREWYTSLHTLINYETNLRQHKPSIILIMQSVNDLLHNADFSVFSHDFYREDYGHFYGPVNQ